MQFDGEMGGAGLRSYGLEIGALMLRAAALEGEERSAFLEQTLQDPELVAEVRRRLELAEAELDSAFLASPTGLAGEALEAPGSETEAGGLPPLPPEERYELGELLGTGGMARVYRATDRELHRTVALKLLSPETGLRSVALREARAQARVTHPGVLAVYETGELGGEIYIAMQHVAGQTLGEMEYLPLETRVRLLAEVAEALHAAHRQGLVHRDVKPSNILVEEGSDGEWKAYIGDFGIALAPDTDSPLASLAGTPAYMAPEQLRGEAIDRRVDVYGLGVTLYRLFTGRLPYVAEDSASDARRSLVEQALEARVTPPRALVESLPAELEAIVLRAMARNPDERYPSARALAEDLRRYLDGEVVEAHAATFAYRLSRHILKHRISWATAGVATLVVILALLVFSVFTRRAEKVADLRRGQAEELLAYMVGDMRTKLAPFNRLEVMKDIGERAMRYFASVPPEELTPTELARRSQVFYQIGDVRMREGDLGAAMEAFDSSLALTEDLHRRDPQRLDWIFELAQSHFWVGYVHFERAEHDQALERFETYLALAERLAAAEPENLDYALEVAYGHQNVGRVQQVLGQSEAALEHFQRHGEVLRRVAVLRPKNPGHLAELADSVLLVGTIRSEAGELDLAARAYSENLGILTDLVERAPDRLDWRERLGIGHYYLGANRLARGEWGSAEESFLALLEIFGGLIERDASNSRWLFNYAAAGVSLASTSRHRGDWEAHRGYVELALSTLDELLVGDPTKVTWRRQRALAGLEQARGARRSGDLETAVREASAATRVLDELYRGRTESSAAALDASRAHLLMGDLQAAAGRSTEARSHWQQTRAISTVFPKLQEHRDLVSRAGDALGKSPTPSREPTP